MSFEKSEGYVWVKCPSCEGVAQEQHFDYCGACPKCRKTLVRCEPPLRKILLLNRYSASEIVRSIANGYDPLPNVDGDYVLYADIETNLNLLMDQNKRLINSGLEMCEELNHVHRLWNLDKDRLSEFKNQQPLGYARVKPNGDFEQTHPINKGDPDVVKLYTDKKGQQHDN